jgi:hypothetical protein
MVIQKLTKKCVIHEKRGRRKTIVDEPSRTLSEGKNLVFILTSKEMEEAVA